MKIMKINIFFGLCLVTFISLIIGGCEPKIAKKIIDALEIHGVGVNLFNQN
jgi:hypothetical protein